MRDLILHFSWERLFSLPPSEFLAVVLLVLLMLGLVVYALLLLTYFFE